MTAKADSLQEARVIAAVREARSKTRDLDVIEGVKKAVADELLRIDESLKIKNTEYFNHSYVPDMVAMWREDGKPQERRIFIRGSLSTVVASRDAEELSDQDPLLISLGDETSPAVSTALDLALDEGQRSSSKNEVRGVVKRLRAQLPKHSNTLATEIGATARISTEDKAGQGEAHLSSLVRANIVRDGRGLLTSKDADRIVSVEAGEPTAALKAFQRTVARLFTGATADRLTRTAGLLGTFFEDHPNKATLQELKEQPLIEGELRVVLPYVLRRAGEVSSPDVWKTLGEMISLEQLETFSPFLNELDLTPLVRPATKHLLAGRSALFLNAEFIEQDTTQPAPPTWRVKNGRLTADIRHWSLWMGSDGRKIRGRDDGPDARWDELSAPLNAFDVTAIELRGLSRQLGVANVDANVVREDVELFRETIEDDFHVATATIREKGELVAPEVKVEFAASTATGRASVDFHIRAANLLAVKRPFKATDINTLTDSTAMDSAGKDTSPPSVPNKD